MMGTDEADQRQAAQVRTQGSNTFSPQEPANRKEQEAMTASVCAHQAQTGEAVPGRKVRWDLFVSKAFLPPLLHMAWEPGPHKVSDHVLKSLL